MSELNTYDDHNPDHPANTKEIEVELSELEQLQNDYFELCQKHKRNKEKIQFCVEVLESPAEDNQNRIVINKLKSML